MDTKLPLLLIYRPGYPVLGPERALLNRLESKYQIFHTSDEEEAVQLMPSVEILFTTLFRPVTKLLQNQKSLKWVHLFAKGTDRITNEPAFQPLQKTVLVSNTLGLSNESLSDHALGFILYWARRFDHFGALQRSNTWNRDVGNKRLCDSTVIILGLGEIASHIARKCSAFGMNVIGVARRKLDKLEYFNSICASKEEFLTFLPQADFVINILPLNESTKHFFTISEFTQMKRDGVFMNLGRGQTVKETDLIEALNQKLILGCSLDVFEAEPLRQDHPLWSFPNVQITPHSAWMYDEYWRLAFEQFLEQYDCYEKGVPLPNLVTF